MNYNGCDKCQMQGSIACFYCDGEVYNIPEFDPREDEEE